MKSKTILQSYFSDSSVKGVSSTRIYLQLIIYLFGFILLIGLQIVITTLIEESKNSIENEYARLKIGDIIINDIHQIETNVYKMVTAQGVKRQKIIQNRLEKIINDLDLALNVLAEGGEVIRIKHLNLINQEEVQQKIVFKQNWEENLYILEIIELQPRVKQIREVIDRLSVLIAQRDAYLVSNKEQYLVLTNQTKQTIQSILPTINRMIENANRLFFDGQKKLNVIKQSVIKREKFYTILQFYLSLIIIIIVLLLGFFILRQVQSSNKKLNKLAEELNFQIFALNQHAIVSSTDVQGNITYINKRFSDISGYAEAELLGKNHRMVKSDEHPAELYRTMWQTISSGKVWQGEIKNKKKDGGFYWVSASIVPFLNEQGKPFKYISIRTDITKRKTMEDEINKSHRFLQSVTDAMGEGVYALDKKGDCIFINRETEKLTGWMQDELLGQNIHNIIHFQNREGQFVAAQDCPTHKSIIKGKNYHSEDEWFTHKDGALFPVSIISVPLYEKNEIIGSVAVFQDISQRKKTEKELMDAKVQAEQANQEKSNFLANMSHEIRTPMNAILGMSYLALQSDLNPEQENYIRKVHFSAESLLRIINDILDFSKIEAGKMDIEHIDFELSPVLENLKMILEDKARNKAIDLIFQAEADIPEYLNGDPLRLSQILINLCNNAIKFTENGQVIVKIQLENKIAPDSIELHFSVQDTGIGISEQQQKLLFKSFSQADSSTTRKYGGTGLGLSISKKLTQLLKGKIWVDSEPDIGSTFHFTIQFKIPENNNGISHGSSLLQNFSLQNFSLQKKDRSINTEQHYQEAVKQLRGANILLVEDNLLNQELTTDLLKKNEINVILANNGQEAIDLLELNDIDGILMDIQMPVMDGYEATTRIRKKNHYTDLPIIAMTASTMIGDNEQALKAGMNDYISKPINIHGMFITMAKWIKVKSDLNKTDYQKPKVQRDIQQLQSDTIIQPVFNDSHGTLDYHNALLRIDNDNDLYLQVLNTFLNEHAANINDIKQALINNQWQKSTRIVHTLKGVSGNIGALSLQQMMIKLELCLAKTDDNKKIILCDELLQNSELCLSQTLKAIKDYILKKDVSEQDKPATQHIKFNKDDFLTGLIKLQDLLKGYDSTSGKFLNELLSLGIIDTYQETMQQLKTLIEQYDYEAADKLISEFINQDFR